MSGSTLQLMGKESLTVDTAPIRLSVRLPLTACGRLNRLSAFSRNSVSVQIV